MFVQRLFTFDGRINRVSYFGKSLLLSFVTLIASLVAVVFLGSPYAIGGGLLLYPAAGAIVFFGTWANLAITVQRLHDIGLSANHLTWVYGTTVAMFVVSAISEQLLSLFSLVVLAISLGLMFWPGQSITNQYGERK